MNHLVCLNFGDYTPPNVRDSHIDAARRWGAEYLELTEPLPGMGGPDNIFACKMRIWRLNLPPGDRVCLIDGDAIIRDDCPNVFRRVPEYRIGGVSCFQKDTPDGVEKHTRAHWDNVCAYLRTSQRFNACLYLNGGLLVYTPKEHDRLWFYLDGMFASRMATMPAMMEQTALNVAMSELRIPCCILPENLNRLGPTAWAPGPMTSYIQHLAPVGNLRGDKRAALAAIEWDISQGDNDARVG